MKFPDTKYMGSKQAFLPFIVNHISRLRFETALDAFSGSSCVAYALKQMDKRVFANDFLKLGYHLAKATIENNTTTLNNEDIAFLISRNPKAGNFIQRKFKELYFSDEDCRFLDNAYANIMLLKSHLKRSLALSALCRACMKKRPRGIFTFVGCKGWDGRKDLKISMQDQFSNAISLLNSAVFTNGKKNRAFCSDVFDLSPRGIDLVYLDTPYVSPHSDCDYTRRYHFVEGLCSYWHGLEIQDNTVTKKIKSYPTAFKSTKTINDAFYNLFNHFKNSIIVVSYGSNGIPNKNEMVKLLKYFKKKVEVYGISHKYSFGNHGHKIGNNNNNVTEYLFIAK